MCISHSENTSGIFFKLPQTSKKKKTRQPRRKLGGEKPEEALHYEVAS